MVQEVEGCQAKTAISPKIGKKLEKSQFLLKLTHVVQEVEGCPTKTVISLKIGKIGEIAVFAKINYVKWYRR